MGYQLIETIEVGSGGAASIIFAGIPQDGVDLVLVISGRSDSTTNALYMGINDEATDVTGIGLSGTGTAANSATTSSGFFAYLGLSTYTANSFGNTAVYIPNYTSSANKSLSVDSVSENNATAADSGIFALSWPVASAITQIRVLTAGNLVEHTTASLYKITAD